MKDKEKLEAIKAEIERLKAPFKKDVEDGCFPTYYCAMLDIECFIDSLPEEPVKDDLEEAAKEHLPYPCPMWYVGDDDGYEEAKKEINKKRECFKLGAQWQKEQIMKDAISAKVTEIYYPNDSCLEIEATLPEDRFEDGDKVLIIKHE